METSVVSVMDDSLNMTTTVGVDTITKNTFMEKVETLTTFKIATLMNTYWFPILIPIGLVGNTLSFLVMIKGNNRKMSTCIYMAAISINDNLMMCKALHHWLVTVIKFHQWQPLECEFSAFIVFVALQNSTFQVVAMTIDKFIAVKWPHKAAVYNSSKRAKVIAIGIFVSVIIYNIPHIFLSRLIGNVCFASAAEGIITKVYSWVSFVLNAVIPFTMLIYMNTVIVKAVRNSRTIFETKEIDVERRDSRRNQIESSSQGKRNKGKKNEKC